MNFHLNTVSNPPSSDKQPSSMGDDHVMAQIDHSLRALLDKKNNGAGTAAFDAGDMDERLSQDAKLIDSFIKDDADVLGMIAYAMHGLNHRDWIKNYRQEYGRAPTEQEISAFLIGERMERRLSAYRRDAQTHLQKKDLPPEPSSLKPQLPKKKASSKSGSFRTLFLYLFLLGVGVVATALSVRTLIDSLGGGLRSL